MRFENSNPKEKALPENPERRKFMKAAFKLAAGGVAAAYGLDHYIKNHTDLHEAAGRRKDQDNFGQTARRIGGIADKKKAGSDEEAKGGQEKPVTEAEDKAERSGAEKIAEEILRTYNSPAVYRRFDKNVFTKDFFMAQQFQESRYVADSESKAGAQGVYQDKPEATQDVVRFLSFLRKKTSGAGDGRRCDYRGPDEINIGTAREIGELLKKKADYGRAIGKLYLLALHDRESPYNNGPNPDVFRGLTAGKQQELLWLSYHDGPSIRYKPDKASRNGREYVRLVNKHMGRIMDLRRRLGAAGLSRDLDYAIIKIMREMEKKENRNDPWTAADRWISRLKEAQQSLKADGKTIFDNESIRKVFDSDSSIKTAKL